MTIETLLMLFLVGGSAGFIDAIAGGGGLITLPVLLGIGLPPQVALGTNKMQSTWGTLLAVRRYARAGLVRWPEVRRAVIVTFVSAAVGTWAVTALDDALLRKVVPWLLLAVAVYALASPRLGLRPGRELLRPTAFAWLFGLTLGFYDGFFGPGAGAFWTLACVTLLGLDLARATAYTKAVNLASNAASLLVFVGVGCVQYKVAAAMVAGQLLGARLGSGLAIRHGAPFIRWVFLAVVLTLVARLFWQQWQGI